MSHSGMSKDTLEKYKEFLVNQPETPYPTPTVKTVYCFKTHLYSFTVRYKHTNELEKALGYFYTIYCPKDIRFAAHKNTLLSNHYTLEKYTYTGNN